MQLLHLARFSNIKTKPILNTSNKQKLLRNCRLKTYPYLRSAYTAACLRTVFVEVFLFASIRRILLSCPFAPFLFLATNLPLCLSINAFTTCTNACNRTIFEEVFLFASIRCILLSCPFAPFLFLATNLPLPFFITAASWSRTRCASV